MQEGMCLGIKSRAISGGNRTQPGSTAIARCTTTPRVPDNHWSDNQCQKTIGVIYVTQKWRYEIIQPGSEFSKLRPWLNIGIFKCISWLMDSSFGNDDRCFLGVNTYNYRHQSRLLICSKTFFCFHLHSLCLRHMLGRTLEEAQEVRAAFYLNR